jgi:hypothetical protein
MLLRVLDEFQSSRVVELHRYHITATASLTMASSFFFNKTGVVLFCNGSAAGECVSRQQSRLAADETERGVLI